MMGLTVGRRSLAGIAAALTLSAGCTSFSPSAPSSTLAVPAVSPAAPGTIGGLEATLSFCASEINRYRAAAGVGPLARSGALEAFAAAAIEYDHKARLPHAYFTTTNGGNGVSRAQNQLLLWKGYAVNEVIRLGLARMWAEGEQGSHRQTMTGPYTEVGCGVFLSGTEVSVSQDFR